jgi:hypothetical protein
MGNDEEGECMLFEISGSHDSEYEVQICSGMYCCVK